MVTETIFVLAVAVIMSQLADAYLRFLAFREQSDEITMRRLRLNTFVWAVLCLPLYALLFHHGGVNASSYKFVLMLGWLPYMAILIHALPGRLVQMLYVFGMSAVWCFTTHNWSSIAVAFFMQDVSEASVISVHAMLYSLWFMVLLPVERNLFAGMLSCRDVFALKPLGIYFALLPYAFLFGHLLMIADGQLWHSWAERISRLTLPVVFILSCRHLPTVAREMYRQRELEQQSVILQKQLAAMKSYYDLMRTNQVRFSTMRRNLCRSYHHLAELIRQDKIGKARLYLKRQQTRLDAVTVRRFSESPVINAAISIYIGRALALGMSFLPQVSLKFPMQTSETDLAVLLSNLLENATEASAKEKENERGMSLILRSEGAQCILEIANRSSKPLRFDDDGLPRANLPGHGIGMISLKNFLVKYDGYADFDEQGGWIRLYMYWEDKPPCA